MRQCCGVYEWDLMGRYYGVYECNNFVVLMSKT